MAKTLESLKKKIEEGFLQTVKDVFGTNLLSVMAYGSYAGGDFVPGVSDVNLLIVLEKPDTQQIRLLGKRTRTPMKKLRITPLIMTRTEFINSADVFPMEYLDISEKNRVLFGTDETEALSISKNNLRHEIEERLRGNINSIRQMIIAAGARTRIEAGALKGFFGPLKALFTALLRLKGKKETPREGTELVKSVADEFGIDTSALERLLELRGGKKHDPARLAVDVLATLEDLARIIDTMNVK